MSWSVSGTLPDGTMENLKVSALAQNPECGDQFDAAAEAVSALIAGGTVGGPEVRFHVVMSGHANPDHAPRSGWANDMINISISQL